MPELLHTPCYSRVAAQASRAAAAAAAAEWGVADGRRDGGGLGGGAFAWLQQHGGSTLACDGAAQRSYRTRRPQCRTVASSAATAARLAPFDGAFERTPLDRGARVGTSYARAGAAAFPVWASSVWRSPLGRFADGRVPWEERWNPRGELVPRFDADLAMPVAEARKACKDEIARLLQGFDSDADGRSGPPAAV